MTLEMSIKNIKAIKELTLRLPLEKGLYAITGENATGKSTITMCAASLFYHFDTKQYFGMVTENSSIAFNLDIRKMMQTAKNYLMIWLLNCHRTERVENI